ncbi:uncharacterized protein LOC125499738 [Athalia rosae]|uniref:uncharacterized protein LOC125499738 n=1 Tax=Athalia rosae TaxID=37344 RepID=UPI0020342420|nr:uncharacterized protein LOC125499738 [Athalia rosae]
MKTTLLLIATVALATPSLAADWTDLTVKWSALDLFRLDSWYGIPTTKSAARKEDWVELPEGSVYDGTTTYCLKDDHHFCTLLDNHGNIAGFQFALTKTEVEKEQAFYDMSAIAMYEEKTLFGKPCWTVTILTVSPDTVKAGGRSKTSNVLGTDGIWIVTKDGYMPIARNVEDLDPAWTKEACIPQMGTHYYYDMSPTTACKNFQPIFLLYDGGVLSGVGYQAFGKTKRVHRQWYEQVPAIAIRPTIPTTPQCLVDWAGEYEVISMHAYFNHKPWTVRC